MKKLLIIAYYFPPIGGAGVQRATKFAKYLAKMGWQIEIVSVEPTGFKPFDPSLEVEVNHPLVHITRVPCRESFKFFDRFPGGWRLRVGLQNWFLFPDQAGGWFKPALKVAESICQANPGIPVLSTSAPFTSHLVARELKRKYQIFWVADFRDEWTQNPYIHFPTPFHARKHQSAEKLVLQEADIVISVTEEITSGLREIATGSNAKFYTIPNGYDPDDFKDIQSETDSAIILTHIGTLNSSRAKLLKPLFEQLHGMMSAGLIPAKDITIQFIGSGSYRELGLEGLDWVKFIDYLPHREAVRYMCNSDLLILAEPSPRAFTGKIFEYLGAKKPILGFVNPQSPAAQLIRESNTGWVVGNQDRDSIQKILLQCYQAKKGKIQLIHPVEEVIVQYNREFQAQQLAKIISS